MTGDAVKGWCPGAWIPMMSGDGLIVRVRPPLGRLTRAAALGLGDIARQHGSGVLELTRRGNVQIRGLSAGAHGAVLTALAGLGLLDPDSRIEARRNLMVSPFHRSGDATCRIAAALGARVADFPDLPGKFGIAVDAGPAPVLGADPADIRVECCDRGILVRADGATSGRAVSEAAAAAAVLELARWFAATRARDERRMAALVARAGLPAHFADNPPRRPLPRPEPGPTAAGALVGVAFGQIDADLWRRAAESAPALRITPWRMLLLEGRTAVPEGLIAGPDPILAADACPGAPRCAAATVETRALAQALARTLVQTGRVPDLHVSGCAKGCARSRPAAVTLVGREGRFDLVLHGRAGDTPLRRGLTPAEAAKAI